MLKSEEGFTLTEILMALMIMMIGFLAMAQMQFLSLKQGQMAESGTVATNALQFVSDRDMKEARRLHLLNAAVYIEAQSGAAPASLSTEYCDGTPPASCPNPPCADPCTNCPCNPLEIITPNPTDGTTEITCAALNEKNFDPDKIVYRTTKAQCEADANDIINNDAGQPIYIVKEVSTDVVQAVGQPDVFNLTITYAIKNMKQFDNTGITSVEIAHSLASQSYVVSAHTDDWSGFIPGWNTVNIPNVP